ncbi:glycosidase [Kouleothrix sp.]|uniref:glycoside hydrolase family 130 protein n=1 Tax=Kouleothrix sp. TaxID=2779161 RepID=UPI00391E00E6
MQPFQMRRLGVIMRGDPHNPDEVLGVLNPAAARDPGGRLFLFPRVVAAGNYSRVGLAEVLFDAAGEPVAVQRRGYVLEPTEPYEQNARTAGCEDARVGYVAPLGRYIMAYTAYGPLGPRIALAESRDLLSWQRIGPLKFAFDPRLRVDFDLYDNKDAFLFPEPVRDPHGRPALALIHRPAHTQGGVRVLPAGVAEPRASIWISYCDVDAAQRDSGALLRWRDHQLLAAPQHEWESTKIGGGAPPLRTPLGWLMIYHGVAGPIVENVDHQPFVHYSAGAMLLDADDPRRVLYRSAAPTLAPEAAEEREGVVPNVVFPTGLDPRPGGRVDVYYGMADAAIGVARLDIPAALAGAGA